MRRRRLLAAAVAVSLVASGCSLPGTQSTETAVSCSYGGSRPFAIVYMNGPVLTPGEFAATPQGKTLDAFFVGGEAEVEAGSFTDLDGFSIVDDGYVLGYRDGLPIEDYRLNGDDVQEWGGCNPTLVHDDRVAGRWHPAEPVDTAATVLPIRVEGGACVENGENRIITEIAEIDVAEDADAVEIVVWTREDFTGMCAGVGVEIDATVTLDAPLGGRTLVDTGRIPPVPATETP